jgi:23S rRNA (uracil1939-C5)-methyltransferase
MLLKITGTIESIAFGGAGVLRHEGMVVFVPFTAPGDVAQIDIIQKKKNFATGKLVHLQQASPHRVTPKCSYFGTCGGCQLQHLSYADQLEAKRLFIAESLKRIGHIDFPVPPVVPAKEQWAYRRHIKLNLRPKGDGFEMGYMNHNGFTLLPIDHCPIFHTPDDPVLKELHQFLVQLSSKGVEEGTVRIIKNGPHTLLAFAFSPKFPSNRQEQITSLLKTHPTWGVVIESELYGNTDCLLDIDGLKIAYAPYGFLQNHPEQSLNLYHAIVQAIPEGTKNVLDLFCGIGISSLMIGKKGVNVTGVEMHHASIALAQKNALQNQIKNVRFVEGDAEMMGEKFLETEEVDCVVVNPPRTGLMRPLIEDLINSKTSDLIYVSCMPSTLSRDLKLLTQGGFLVTTIQSFDMFPQTTHVETLVKLTRSKK